MATIEVLQNGPFLVEGDSKVVDWNGAAYQLRKARSQDKSARQASTPSEG